MRVRKRTKYMGILVFVFLPQQALSGLAELPLEQRLLLLLAYEPSSFKKKFFKSVLIEELFVNRIDKK